MGKYVCPKCGSDDVYEGTEIVSERVHGRSVGFENEFGGTISREVGGGTTHKQITVVKCRKCDTMLGEKDCRLSEKEILNQREEERKSDAFWDSTGNFFGWIRQVMIFGLVIGCGYAVGGYIVSLVSEHRGFVGALIGAGIAFIIWMAVFLRLWRAENRTIDAWEKPESTPILKADEAAKLLAFDIGKWNGAGHIKEPGEQAKSVKFMSYCDWKEEGESLVTTGTIEIDSQKAKFIGFKCYNETKGIFITRTKSESFEERISHEYYEPATKTYHGKSVGSWGLPSKFSVRWTSQIIGEGEITLEQRTYNMDELVENLEIQCTRIGENFPEDAASVFSSERRDAAGTVLSDSSYAAHGSPSNPKCKNIRNEGWAIMYDCPHCGTDSEIDKQTLIRVWEESAGGLITCPVDECAKKYVAPTLHEISKLD